MRYFYKDPLAAAWMAKHFGMKLLKYWHDFYDPNKVYYSEIDFEEILREASRSINELCLVHSDSLQLLHPRLGDVLYSRIGGGVSVEEILSDERALQTGPHIIQRGGRIIQRDGKPFFWPKREVI